MERERRKKGRPISIDAQGLSSRTRMIIGAEKLFADKGIEGVSLREIVQATGQGNSNAVQYHFGSKAGLVFAIFEHRVAEMELLRRQMLDRARNEGRLGDIRTLLAVLFRPYLDLVDEAGRHNYASFMSEYLVRYRPLGLKHAGDNPEQYSHALGETVRLIDACVGHLPADLRQNRLEIFHLMFFNMVVRWDQSTLSVADRMPLEMLVEDSLNMAASAYLVPVPPAAAFSGVKPAFD